MRLKEDRKREANCENEEKQTKREINTERGSRVRTSFLILGEQKVYFPSLDPWDRIFNSWDRTLNPLNRILNPWDRILNSWDRILNPWDRILNSSNRQPEF